MDIPDVPFTEENIPNPSEEQIPAQDVNPTVLGSESTTGGTGSRIGDIPPELPGEGKDFKRSVTDVVNDMAETVGDMGKSLTESLGNMGSTVSEALGDVGSSVGHKLGDVGSSVTSTLSGVGTTVGSALGDVSHAIIDQPILGMGSMGTIQEALARGVALLTGTSDETFLGTSQPIEQEGQGSNISGQSELKTSSKTQELEGLRNPPNVGGDANLLGAADALTGLADRSQ